MNWEIGKMRVLHLVGRRGIQREREGRERTLKMVEKARETLSVCVCICNLNENVNEVTSCMVIILYKSQTPVSGTGCLPSSC